ncbi:hypothetical protein BC829DRAFT_404870, partial [Chytridium lagenaria]
MLIMHPLIQTLSCPEHSLHVHHLLIIPCLNPLHLPYNINNHFVKLHHHSPNI